MDSRTTPPPPDDLALTLVAWPQGNVIHRIHQGQYDGDQFNPGLAGNARFSPIKDAEGQAIPTLYGGENFDCAAMETVFHDVPHVPGFKSFDKRKLEDQVYSQITPEQDLMLVDLGSKALRKLGVPRHQLIDTEKDQYPATRAWAEAIHAQCPQAQGLQWTSRQDDGAKAMILFGDRIDATVLRAMHAPRSLLGDDAIYEDVLGLAERIGVDLVPGKS